MVPDLVTIVLRNNYDNADINAAGLYNVKASSFQVYKDRDEFTATVMYDDACLLLSLVLTGFLQDARFYDDTKLAEVRGSLSAIMGMTITA